MIGATHDAAFTLGVVGAFALLATAHVANVFGVIKRRGGLPALGALVLPPLAPYFAARAGMSTRACLWVAAAAAYGIALLGARA